mmetsp:Transcript_21311/g.27710  ORF Transcript_21311/g.27710 Transcript_21311/m.27710 type:complete len:1112 (+) Transcript_21311:77-3412(+)
MSYDPMAALDMEKRLGVKNADIDDFLRKANSVQEAIQGLKDGTLDPSKEIEIEGIETEAVKKAKAEELAKKKEAYLIKEAKKKAKMKEEEKEKWWRGAELFRDLRPDIVNDDDEDNDLGEKKTSTLSSSSSETAKRDAMLQRYSSDYSRWELPVVDDPATVAEQAELQAANEEKENAEFEKNNPDFCGEFRVDQEKRAAAAKDKESGANVLRLKGNRFFKAKRFSEAIEKYMASLKVQPYTVNTLNNIAIAYHKKNLFEDAVEFSNRAVYLDSTHIKARVRRAASLKALGRLEDAFQDAKHALKTATVNKQNLKSNGLTGKSDSEAMKVADIELIEVTKLVEELQGDISDRDIEQAVASEAAKALVKDAEIEKKLKAQMQGLSNPSSSKKDRKENSTLLKSKSSQGKEEVKEEKNEEIVKSSEGFKKVVIDMDDSSSGDEKEVATTVKKTSPKTMSNNKQNKKKKTKEAGAAAAAAETLPIDFTSSDPFSNLELPSQYKLIDELIATLKDPLCNGIAKSGVPALDVLSVLLKESKEARVYLRTSESLMFLCCRLCGGGLAKPSPVSNVIGARPDGEGFDLDDDDGLTVTGRPLDMRDSDPARTMATIAIALEDERKSKVMVRDQGVLAAAIQLLNQKDINMPPPPPSTSSSSSSSNSNGNGVDSFFSAKFMMESISEDTDAKLVSSLLENGHGRDAIRIAALSLLTACVDGVGRENYALCIASDIPSLVAILSALPSSSSSNKSNTQSSIQAQIRQFSLTSSLLREMCLVDHCRDMFVKNTLNPNISSSGNEAPLADSFRFFPVTESENKKKEALTKKKIETNEKSQQIEKAPDPVSVLACALEVTRTLCLPDVKTKQELLDARDSAAGALANLALHPAMRTRFNPALIPLLEMSTTFNDERSSSASVSNKSSKHKKTSSSTKKSNSQGGSYMIDVETSSFALAALINVLISEQDMKIVLANHKGVQRLLKLIQTGILGGKFNGVIRVRGAALLSKLAPLPIAIDELRKDVNLNILAEAVLRNKDEFLSQNKDQWLSDEREHLVRILAAILSGKGHQAAVQSLHTSNTLSLLVDFLPRACRDSAGKVTASSVVMPSPDKVSFKVHFITSFL